MVMRDGCVKAMWWDCAIGFLPPCCAGGRDERGRWLDEELLDLVILIAIGASFEEYMFLDVDGRRGLYDVYGLGFGWAGPVADTVGFIWWFG